MAFVDLNLEHDVYLCVFAPSEDFKISKKVNIDVNKKVQEYKSKLWSKYTFRCHIIIKLNRRQNLPIEVQ